VPDHRDNGGLGHPRQGAQVDLDVAELDAAAVQLDLAVDTPREEMQPVLPEVTMM
jgi:hypothetical protein